MGEECGVRVGVVGVEISTGDVVYGEFKDGFLRTCVEAFLLSLAPSELLLGLPLSKQTEKVTFYILILGLQRLVFLLLVI